jgi:repressor LexA
MNHPNQPITPRQLAVLKAIAHFEKSCCYSPTIAELANQLSVARTTVFEHIARLREKNLLDGTKGKARSLKLTKQASQLLDNLEGSEQYKEQSSGSIALLGNVAAGNPIDAIEDRQELSLTSVFGDSDEVFALEVRGDSMIDAGLNTGDYVVCKRTSDATNGQIVVAIVDDDTATVKRFFQEANRIRLQPENENYEPIYTDNCRIEGVVLGSISKF